MNRRTALRLMSFGPFIGVLDWTTADVARAATQVDALPVSAYEPVFFTDHEWQTVHVLVDLIIPRDARSGSATDAKVPEFMDFMLNEGSQGRRDSMRTGLEWLDAESRRRFDVAFLDATDAQRRSLLDEIAWPDRAPPALRRGVDFFNSFRDMTAAGFFSSKMGYDDLQYMGGPKGAWPGCPDEALRKLGVSYDVMEERR